MARKKSAMANHVEEGERDQQQQKRLEGAFSEALDDVRSAQEATETKYWRDQFGKRRKDLSMRAKNVQAFVEHHEITDVDSIKTLMKQLKDLSVSLDHFNELVNPIISLVKDLNEFSHTYKLFAEVFTHQASFDMETGKLTIKDLSA